MILKPLFMLLICCTLTIIVKAQTAADSVYNAYTDFNLARLEGSTTEAFSLSQQILLKVDKLPEKSRIGFYNSLGKLYEDANQPDKALPLYEKVAAAVPDYYVVHLALGHLYLTKAEQLQTKKDISKTNMEAYVAAVRKVLPHLEKVQACDPYEENLTLIQKLYTNINDPKGFAGLNERVKALSKKCLDILDEN